MAEDQRNGDFLGDIEALRPRLAGRVAACFDRIDDAVSELVAVHSLDVEEIVAFVRSSAAGGAPEVDESALA